MSSLPGKTQSDTDRRRGRHRVGRSWPCLEILRVRLIEHIRTPEAIFWVYFFPLLMVLALGIAFRNKPVERVNVAVVAGAMTPDPEQVFAEDDRIIVTVAEEETCRRLLRSGKVSVVVLPQSNSTQSDGFVYWFDPTRPGSLIAKSMVDDFLQRAGVRTDVLKTKERQWNEPGGRYIDFLIPGMLGMGLMGGGLWGVGFVIVDMRIRKVLKRLMATPMRRSDLLIGVMLSRMVFMIPEMFLLLIFARYGFGVVNYGSYLTVVFLVILGAFQFSGIGLLVACRVRTMEAISGLMNLTMLPMWMLSGIFFSYERFPEAVHPLIRVLPLTSLIDALRAVMQDGAHLSALIPEISLISIWSVSTFCLALFLFRWSD